MRLKSRNSYRVKSVSAQMGPVIIDMPADSGGFHLSSSPDEIRIPTKIPSVPGLDLVAGAMLAGSSDGAALGGDFLDVFPLGSGFGLTVGAVAGRGEGTSALAKVAKFTLRAEAFQNSAPSETDSQPADSVDLTMCNASAILFQCLHRQPNYSLLHGRYEPQERVLTFCNGSRWPPALVSNGQVIFLEERHRQLGEHWQRQYPPIELTLSQGDTFVAFTDGLPEACRSRSILGIGPIRRVLQEHAGASAAELARQLVVLPRRFCGDSLPQKDALVLVARVLESNLPGDGQIQILSPSDPRSDMPR